MHSADAYGDDRSALRPHDRSEVRLGSPVPNEVASADDLRRVLRGAYERDRVQPRVDQPSEEALSAHRCAERRYRDDGAKDWQLARDPPREPRTTPPRNPVGQCHGGDSCKWDSEP
jgi:hypothetical protein